MDNNSSNVSDDVGEQSQSVVENIDSLLEIMASKLIEAGKHVIACQQKRPTIPKWNSRPTPTIEEVKQWLRSGKYDGIGVVQGSQSGGEFTLDFETIEAFENFKSLALARGVATPSPVCKIKTGSGAYHLPFVCSGLTTETRPTLAKSADGELLIELLGEGCFCVRPPSAHPSGGHYEVVRGDPCNLPILTIDEANQLVDIAKEVDQSGLWSNDDGGLPWSEIGRPKPTTYEASALDVIAKVNAEYSIENLLTRLGYIQGPSGWSHPNNDSCTDSVKILDGSKSSHFGTNDPIRNSSIAHHSDSATVCDCFTLWAELEGHADRSAAIRAASKAMGMDGRSGAAKPNKANVAAKGETNTNEPTWRSDLVWLNTVEEQAVDWLWFNRFPLGELSTVFGNGGGGKSQLSLSLAATVTRGGAWPDGSAAPKGKVILVTGEDSTQKTILPRLLAVNADVSMVGVLPMITCYDEKGEPYKRTFSLADIPNLAKELEHQPDTKLVIIDPIAAFMDGVDTHRDSDVRGLLTPLHQMAEKYNVAVIMVAHCNKAKGVKAAAKMSGSVGFVNAVRSAFYVEKNPNADGNVIIHVKSNLAPIQPTLSYEVEQVERGTDRQGKTIRVSRIHWLGECDVTADDAISAAEQITTVSDEAREYLQDILSGDTPRYADDIEREAKTRGIGKSTLYAAKKSLGIQSGRVGFGGRAIWKMPTSDTNDTE